MSREGKEPSDNSPVDRAGTAMRTRTDSHPGARPRTALPAAASSGEPEVAAQTRASAACCALLRPSPAPAAWPSTIDPGTVGTRRRVDGR
jgi:hypothetical protein